MRKKSFSRRRFLSLAAGIAAGSMALPSLGMAQSQAGKRPNIIFLLTDDQRWDSLGCMSPHVQTPNIDAMARQGVIFSNSFVTTSICCTSRASFFTGQYALRHGIHGFHKPFTPKQMKNTYMMQLKQGGYRTGFIGKYGVGNSKEAMPADKFDYWGGFAGQSHYEQTDKDGKPIHLTRMMGNQAVEFLAGCKDDQPFCLSVSFKAPHCQDGDSRQFITDPAYDHVYNGQTMPPAPFGSEEDWQRFPEFFKEKNQGRMRWEKRFSTPELHQKMVKAYYQLIYGVDVVVGRIRKQLEEMGQSENTVIIYSGDNGFFLGEHGLAGKWYPYEESIRVPLIVFDPRQDKATRGKRRDEIALNIDLAPTILSYAGIKAPDCMQGLDLMPLVRGNDKSWRKDFFYEHRYNNKTIPKTEAVIGTRYKYIRYYEQTPIYEELYDLKSDPHEINNIIDDERYAAILKQMRKRYKQLYNQAS